MPHRSGPASRAGEGDPVELVLPTRTIVALVIAGLGTVAAVWLVDALSEVIYVVVLAVTLAALLLPGVERLSRRLPRGVAVALLVSGSLAVLSAVVVGGARDLSDQASAATTVLHHRFEALDRSSMVGRFVQHSEISQRTTDFVNGLPSQLMFGVDRPADAPRRLAEVVVVTVLTLFALGGGPRMLRAGLVRIADPDRRRRVGEVVTTAVWGGIRLVRRSLAMGAACGVVGGTAAYLLGAPGAVALGAWSALWAVVPVLGVWVGFTPLVLLAGAVDPWRGAVALSLTVVLAIAVRVARQRWVDTTTHLGPLLTIVAIATGLRLAGPVACVPALFVTAVAAGAVRAAGRRGGLSRPAAALDEFAQGVTERSEDVPTARAPLWRTAGSGNAGQLPVTISWRSIALLAGLVVVAAGLIGAVQRVPSVAIWTVLGLALGVALNPAVDAADRWLPGRRSAAVGFLGVGAALAIAALLVPAVPALVDAVRSLPRELPDTAARVAGLPLLDRFVQPAEARATAQRFIDRLPERLGADGGPLTTIAAQAGDTLFGSLWTVLIAVAALLDGHRLLAASRRALPPRLRPRAQRLADLAYQSFGRYAAGSALVALLNGVVVTVLALALGIPVAPLLGLWALLWNFVPQIGGFVGGAPLVLLGFTRSPLSGVVAFVGFIAYQNLENHVIQPVVIGKAVRLSPFSIMVCVLAGGAAGGLIGAVLATPLVGAVKVLACQLLPVPAPADRIAVEVDGPTAPSRVDDPSGRHRAEASPLSTTS